MEKDKKNEIEDWSNDLYGQRHEFSGATLILTSDKPQYKVNINNIETIDDIKLILKHLNLHFNPTSKEEYEEIKHLLIVN